MRAYPFYKKSNLDWLEKIPTDWEVKKLKNVSQVYISNVDKKSVEGEVPVKLCNYVDVYYNNCIHKHLEFMDATAKKEQIEKFELQKDDVLLTKDSETPNDIGVPSWVSQNLPGVICGYHLSLIRPFRELIKGEYLYYLLVSNGFKEQFWVNAKGVTRYGISKGSIQNINVLLPSLLEQTNIVSFLNRKTAEIDRLIDQKEKLIKLLQEKRQSIITETVTKGLNQNVKMKDSGVEWIGEIPEHWIVNKIKRLVDILTCGYASTPTYVDKEGGIPFLSAQNVSKSGKLVLDKYNYISPELHSSLIKNKKPLKGDILQVRVGAGIGQTCIVDVDFEFSIYVSLTHIRPSKFIHNRFLKYLLSSKKFNEFANMQTLQAGGVGNLNVSDLEKSKIPYPLLNEQIEISDYLDQKLAGIEEAIDMLKNQNQKLKDYRQSLIYEAVTGKIDLCKNEVVS